MRPRTSTRRMVARRPWLGSRLWPCCTDIYLRAPGGLWSSGPLSIKRNYGRPGTGQSAWSGPERSHHWGEIAHVSQPTPLEPRFAGPRQGLAGGLCPLINDYPVGERARVADPEVQRPLQVQRRPRTDRPRPSCEALAVFTGRSGLGIRRSGSELGPHSTDSTEDVDLRAAVPQPVPEEDDVLELDPPWMVTSLVCSTVIRPTSGARRTKKTDCAWASPAPMHRLATASKPINAPSPRS